MVSCMQQLLGVRSNRHRLAAADCEVMVPWASEAMWHVTKNLQLCWLLTGQCVRLFCSLCRCGRCRASLGWPSCASRWVHNWVHERAAWLPAPGKAGSPLHGAGMLPTTACASRPAGCGAMWAAQACALHAELRVSSHRHVPLLVPSAGGDGGHPRGEAAAGGRPGGEGTCLPCCYKLSTSSETRIFASRRLAAGGGLGGEGTAHGLAPSHRHVPAAQRLLPCHRRDLHSAFCSAPPLPAGGHGLCRGVALAPRLVGALLGIRGTVAAQTHAPCDMHVKLLRAAGQAECTAAGRQACV